MKRPILSLSFAALTLAVVSAPAWAQGAESAPPPPPPAAASSSFGGGGAGIGVGASESVSGLGLGIPVGQFVFDQALFHIEGMLGFTSVDNGPPGRRTTFVFGAGGWYHLHRGSASDFSVGGLLAVNNASGGGPPSATTTILEPGAQVRVFLTPNVALHARVGFGFVFGDRGGATQFLLGGQTAAAFGFTYFFR